MFASLDCAYELVTSYPRGSSSCVKSIPRLGPVLPETKHAVNLFAHTCINKKKLIAHVHKKKKLASAYSVREVVHVARDVDDSALYSARRRGGDELGHQLVDEEEVPEVVHREMNFTFFRG
jgi:hypothetical protein